MRGHEGLHLEDVECVLGEFRLTLDAGIGPRERVAVLGASGSGKSTLMSVIAGFLIPDAGQVSWSGRDLSDLPPSDRPVSILFQDGNLFPHLTVAQNVALALRTDLRLSTEEVSRVESVLARVGLGGMGARKPADLSGGQRGRAALARIMLQDRPIALLDEPFSALDPGLRRDMAELLAEIAGEVGLTYVMATHDLRDAERLCDRLWLLEEGRLILDSPVDGLRDTPPEALHDWL